MNLRGDGSGAADRARWLAELAEAIGQAQRLAWRLPVSQSTTAELEGLYRRLETVRVEIDALRRGAWGSRPADIGPLWTNLLGWRARPD